MLATPTSLKSRLNTCDDAVQVTDGCGPGWVYLKSTCYYVSLVSANWSTAHTYCSENGATLLSSKSEEPMETLWNMTRPHSWWIDTRRTSLNKGVWKWLDSESVFSSQLTPWDRSESTDGEDTRDCAEMDYSGLLNDVQCDSSLRFVCEKPTVDVEKNPDQCDPLNLYNLTAGCYTISTQAISWWEAQETCYKKGGNLLSISSLDEQTDMLMWLREKSKRWWVGLYRISPGVNRWSWLDSAVNFSSLVTPWATNEPNDWGGKEDCVEISPRGQLNDQSCYSTIHFICEKSLGTTGENGVESCGVGWFLFNRRCYHLSKNTQSWFSASKNCQKKGGNLLSIKSAEELERIRQEIRKKSERWWVGLRKISQTNSSSHDRTECCCEEITRGGHLNYADCSDVRPFICKKQIRAKSTTRTIDCGSEWFLISGVCLKLSTKTMSWSQAQESCKVEGGNLMSTSILHELIEVQTLTNLGSSRWWIGERTTSLKCVAISSSGSVHVEDCNTAHPYICEKRQYAAQEDWCDPGWNAFTTTCFKLFMEPKNWSAAQTYCEEMDGNLLSVNAKPGLERVTKGMRVVNDQSNWWTGWHKRIENKTVIDLDAKTSFLNQLWRKGEPNHRYNEDCAEIDINGTLNDVRCDRNNNYICVKFSTSGQESTQTIEDCGPGWFLMHRACYKLSTDALPWESAKKNCEVDGGYLLSVSSVAEMNLIKKEMRNANRRNTWWVGLQRAAPYSKSWVWLDSGSPFSARVTRWSPSEPNNENGRENCVEITSDGTLSDKDCEEVRPFVCERHEITPRPRLEYTTEAITSTSTTTPLTTTTITSTSTATTTTATTSTTASTPASSSSTVVLEELPSSTLLSSSSTPSSTTTTPAPTTPAPTTTSTMTSTEEKKIPKPKPPETLPIENKRTLEDLYKLYSGCYLQEPRGGAKDMSFLYQEGSSMCPSIEVSQIVWPETSSGVTRDMKCRTGQGKAYFQCGGSPVCWRGQPNVDECASPEFKKILDQVKSTNDTQNPPEPKQTVALTTQLADVTESDDLTSDDVMATSKVISGLVTSGATQKLKDESEVEAIVSNVVKAGSNLVSTNKSRVWTDMPQQDKIRSATSLMVAMETATVAMAEKIDKPTVINTKDENIELELRVINITSVSPAEKENIVYNAENSENTFSIPLETLSHLSHGGLAKVVFMTHYTMGDILGDTAGGDKADEGKKPDDTVHTRPGDSSKEAADDVKQETPAPKLASYILSASVGGQGEGRVKLPQPVTFTMKHLKMVPAGWDSLCSFWEISESQMGSWSQEGCRVVRSNASQTTCECDHMTNFAVLMAVQEVKISETHQSFLKLATIVGCVISCICLLASWITFTCFTTLQGERNSIHKNLVVCLFIAEMLFLTGIDQTQNRVACGFIAGFLHYFFLASFLWMLLEGVHIVLMLVQVFDASRSRLPYYYATAYAPPFLIIAISAGLYHQGYGTERYCWLTTERYFIWSFAGPVAVILFVNAVILVYAMTMVCRHSEYVFSGKDKTAGGIRSWIQGAAALEVLLGLTWILGYFFLNTQTLALAYLFTALNSLQGLFIFCFHCLLNKKARKEYRRVMKVKRRPSTTTGSGTGTHSASLGHKHKHDLSLDAPGGPLFHSHA